MELYKRVSGKIDGCIYINTENFIGYCSFNPLFHGIFLNHSYSLDTFGNDLQFRPIRALILSVTPPIGR